MRGQAGVVAHHNHPGSTSLSYGDLNLLTGNNALRELWAHGHDGSSYKGVTRDVALTRKSYDLASKRLQAEITKLVATGRVSATDANLAHFQHTQPQTSREGRVHVRIQAVKTHGRRGPES
jgi:hypothetical protein